MRAALEVCHWRSCGLDAPAGECFVDDFDAYYERYRAHCIRAGVEPLTPEGHRARLEEWEFLLGHWRDTEPQKAGDDDNQWKQLTH